MKKNILFVYCLLFTVYCFSQDIIYKKDNTKIEAKILEINQSEVRYKMFTNPDGPLYIMYKSDVVKIEYPNGQVEVYNPEIKKEEPQIVKDDYAVKTERQKDAYSVDGDFMRNVVSINLLQAMLGFASASYEWVEPKGVFGIKIPIGYNFDSGNSISLATLSEDNSNFFGGIAFNLYPKRKKRVSYVVGPYFQIGQFSYKVYQYNGWGGPSTNQNYDDGVYYALYVNNGLEVLIARDFSFSFCGGPGLIRKSGSHYNNSNNGFDLPITLNGEFNLSYRF